MDPKTYAAWYYAVQAANDTFRLTNDSEDLADFQESISTMMSFGPNPRAFDPSILPPTPPTDNACKQLARILNELPQHLGEDSDFQAIDDLTDDLWRLLFDALNVPQGRTRTDLVHTHFNIEGSNLDTAYQRNDPTYDHTYDTMEI
jgi:hypothetical protein